MEMEDDESLADEDEEEEEWEGGEREYVEAEDSEDDMEDYSGSEVSGVYSGNTFLPFDDPFIACSPLPLEKGMPFRRA